MCALDKACTQTDLLPAGLQPSLCVHGQAPPSLGLLCLLCKMPPKGLPLGAGVRSSVGGPTPLTGLRQGCTHSLIPWFIHLFPRSLIYIFLHPFIQPLIFSFINSLTHSFIQSLIFSLVYNPIIHSSTHFFTIYLTHSLFHSFIH